MNVLPAASWPLSSFSLTSGSPAAARNVWQPVVPADDLVGHRPGLDLARPADHARHPERALPVGVLLAAERGHGAVRPGVHVRAVVGRVEDDGVVGDLQVVERLEQLADVPVVLDHAVGVLGPGGQPRRAAAVCRDVRAQVHPRAVEPAEERLARPWPAA